MQDLTGDLAKAFGVAPGRGVVVAEVADDSGADQAGLQAGDVITAVAGYPVISAQQFHNFEGQFPVNEVLELEYVRDREAGRADVRVEELQVLDGGRVDRRLVGAIFEELSLRQRSDDVAGVLISDLEPDSRLARQGLREGDIITGANRMKIRDLGEFREVIRSVSGPLYLQVRRSGNDYVARID